MTASGIINHVNVLHYRAKLEQSKNKTTETGHSLDSAEDASLFKP